MGAGIPANGTRSDDRYLPTHAFLPAFPLAEASAPAGLITSGEPRRTGRHNKIAYDLSFDGTTGTELRELIRRRAGGLMGDAGGFQTIGNLAPIGA
jgi:hypothetical protein